MQHKKHNNVKKGLLFTTAALIFATPICLAEAATAQVNGADDSYSALQPGLQQLQKQQVSALGLPVGSFLGQTPQTIRSFKFPILSADITLDDVILLQSRLTIAESQLRTLKAATPRDPQLKAQIDALIQQAETQVLNLSNALKTADTLYKKYQAATKQLDTAQTQLQNAAEQEALALEQYNVAKTNYENAQETLRLSQLNRTSTEAFLNEKLQNQSQLASAKLSALEILTTATQNLEQKTAAHTTIQGRYDQALQAKNSAQQAYDTELIPDPTWTTPTHEVAYTRQVPNTREVTTTIQVPHTTTQVTGGLTTKVYNRNGYNNAPPMPYATEQPIYTTTVPNVDFNWGGSQVLNSGRQEDVIVEFKGFISPTTSGYYRFYTPADDGTKLYINDQLLIDDWYDKGGGGSVSAPIYLQANTPNPVTLYYYENGGGAAVSFYYYTPTEGYRIVPAAWLGTQTQTSTYYTTETQTTTETYYTEETYYVTEPVTQVQKTLNVNISEGGQATFNAPAGSTFVSSNLRYESYNNPNCGANIYPQVNGLSSVTLQANNAVYGDPCGGQVKHITGTLTYLGQPTAPLINDPAKLATLTAANVELVSATEALSTAAQEVTTAETAKQTATTDYAVAQSNFDEATEAVNIAHTAFTQADEQTTTASTEAQAVQTTYETATTQYETAKTVSTQALATKQEAEAETEAVSTSYQSSVVKAKSIPTPDDTLTQVAELQTKEPEPAQPTEEKLPTEITADSILATDLTQIDPTQMTPEQADQLVAAALVIFETAEEGSPEYEQALDALYLAAEQDDIVLDPALAAIPGLQAATELVNFLGNAGADMSPKKREESKKIVVSAVVAAGTAIQSAAAAASTASAGTTRRTGK